MFKSIALVAVFVTYVLASGTFGHSERFLQAGYTLVERYPTHLTFAKGSEFEVVKLPRSDFLPNLKSWISNSIAKANGVNEQSGNTWCPSNTYFDFIPQYHGSVFSTAPLSWSGDCFTQLTVSLQVNNGDGFITVTASGQASHPFCSDFILFGNREHAYFHEVAFAGTHSIHIDEWMQFEKEDIALHGLFAFTLPCGVVGTGISLAKTFELFDGSNLQASNVDFMKVKMAWDMVPYGKQVKPLTSDIRSGDYLAIMRLDGLDPLVMFGTGGHTGHSAIAVWEGSQLWVCESTDANPFGPVYWPPPYGVIRTPWDQWYSQAIKAQYHVAMLPLSPRYASAFNETAFWQWFGTVQGLPYGYHNFLYSFLDTYPLQNLPAPLVDQTFTFAINAWYRLANSNDTKVNVYSLIIEGLNKRMNLQCPDIYCINDALDQRNSSLTEQMAIPEVDGWVYNDGQSMVCSVFAAQGWKVGLGSLMPVFEGTEQTPKDNYMMGIFDPSRWNDTTCPGGVQNTPNGTYCQLLGPFILTLPGYNTVPPYEAMNDHCPGEWPQYFRCPADHVQCC